MEDSSSSAIPSKNDGSSNILSDRIACLDQTLVNFADTASASTRTRKRRNLWNTTTSSPSLTEITQEYAAVTQETQFQDLYRVLRVMDRTNASAFLQGARGTGKSVLLNSVLAAVTDEWKFQRRPPKLFRLVHVNGIAVPGHSVQTVVREIVQQLSDAAFRESVEKRPVKKKAKRDGNDSDDNDDDNEEDDEDNRLSQMLRLKQTSFTNQLQLLTEILQIACVDGVPILFVLDELDAFLGNPHKKKKTHAAISSQNAGWMHQDRQLLLYHLLERVATEGSLCSLVGMTADSAIMTKLEKRIKSRAEGTAKFLLTGPCQTYQALTNVLCGQIAVSANDSETTAARQLKDELSSLLATTSTGNNEEQCQRVQDSLLRCYRLGKDLRWFSRVMYSALALYRYDLVERQQRQETDNIPFHCKYLEEALVDMGGSLLRGGNNAGTSTTTITETDFRLQALRDLSGPQVALLLAARRILFRDSSTNRTQDEAAHQQPQLTLKRMLHEYRSSYKGQSARYMDRILQNAFVDMMEVNIFRPAMDHTGSGPFQYLHRDVPLGDHNNLDVVERMPLQLALDIHREIKQAIDNNMLNCSTALREWGRKAN